MKYFRLPDVSVHEGLEIVGMTPKLTDLILKSVEIILKL